MDFDESTAPLLQSIVDFLLSNTRISLSKDVVFLNDLFERFLSSPQYVSFSSSFHEEIDSDLLKPLFFDLCEKKIFGAHPHFTSVKLFDTEKSKQFGRGKTLNLSFKPSTSTPSSTTMQLPPTSISPPLSPQSPTAAITMMQQQQTELEIQNSSQPPPLEAATSPETPILEEPKTPPRDSTTTFQRSPWSPPAAAGNSESISPEAEAESQQSSSPPKIQLESASLVQKEASTAQLVPPPPHAPAAHKSREEKDAEKKKKIKKLEAQLGHILQQASAEGLKVRAHFGGQPLVNGSTGTTTVSLTTGSGGGSSSQNAQNAPKPAEQGDGPLWGYLISQRSTKGSVVELRAQSFTVGTGLGSHMVVTSKKNEKISCVLSKKPDGSCVLTNAGDDGLLSLNGESMPPCSEAKLNSGDEIVISFSGGKRVDYFLHVDDVLASLPSLPPAQPLLLTTPPISTSTLGASTTASGSGSSPQPQPPLSPRSTEMESTDSELAEPPTANQSAPTDVPPPPTSDQQLSPTLSSGGSPPIMSIQSGSGSGTSGEISATAANQSDPIDSEAYERYLRVFEESVKNSKLETTTLDSFPNYLSSHTRHLLLDTMYAHVKCPELAQYVASSKNPQSSRQFMFVGPEGSELYQERLARALASHFGIPFLLLDMDAHIVSTGPGLNEDDGDEDAGDKRRGMNSFHRAELRMKSLSQEEDFAGGGGPGGQTAPQVAVNGVLRNFEKGDRVRYRKGVSANGNGSMAEGSAGGALGDIFGFPVARYGAREQQAQPQDKEEVHSGPPKDLCGTVVMLFEKNPKRVGVQFDKRVFGGHSFAGLCPEGHGYVCSTSDVKFEDAQGNAVENACLRALFDTAVAHSPCMIYVRKPLSSLAEHKGRYAKFKDRLEKLAAPVIVIGSSTKKEEQKSDMRNDPMYIIEMERRNDSATVNSRKHMKLLKRLFPHEIPLPAPTEPSELIAWKDQVREDRKTMIADGNRELLRRVMERKKVTCDRIDTEGLKEQTLSWTQAERVLLWAVNHTLRNYSSTSSQPQPQPTISQVSSSTEETPTASGVSITENSKIEIQIPTSEQNSGKESTETENKTEHDKDVVTGGQTEPQDVGQKRGDCLVVASGSIRHAITLHNSAMVGDSKIARSLQDVVPKDQHERMLLQEVVPPSSISVRFDDVGALEKVKDLLTEVVMLPLSRPELFRRGNLTQPTKGVLLFGPPGTGKTMIAKALAKESGANFLSISNASLTSMWFGEAEKLVRAVFTLAQRIAPCIIFVDEVDSMLGRRGHHQEHEATRKMTNEFMAGWDGLRSTDSDRILVMGATNRPFDLDEAVLRRMPRRVMVDLPNKEARMKILKILLDKEEVESGFNIEKLADMTENYSGSDLKNLCVAAAYLPIREIVQIEKEKRKAAASQTTPSDALVSTATEKSAAPPQLRAIAMRDFEKAMKDVRPSTNEDAETITELRKWNELYGEGGSGRRRDHTLWMYT